MKLNIKYLIRTIIVGGAFLSLTSCNESSMSAKDVIKKHYGNEEFKISFSDTNLTSSLEDIIYTANNIPKLPTPTKVGYRFAGWYFDSNYINPYNSDYLYTKMCDLTLYAKWEKEDFINNGIYEIDYECNIISSTISKGVLADKYGYLEFPDLINEEETYIEKNNNGTFLRIQYDMKYHCPTIDENGELGRLTLEVTDSTNRVSDSESIIDRTGTIETIYYDISGLNIADPITLTVNFYNWNAKLNTNESRDDTEVSYKINFEITNFIGYTTSYVDSNSNLEDGYYLVKTHYAALDKGTSMLDTFNPVYSYIIAKDGNYKLIKPMNSYNSDILGNLEASDYIDLKTGFSRDIAYFTFDNNIVPTSEQMENYSLENWPSIFNASSFGDLSYEFDATTGKYYYVFDLGNKCDKDIFLVGASSGAMAEMFNSGPSYKRVVIDYSSMIKLSSIDYTELAGDSYTYQTSQNYYFLTNRDELAGNTIFNAETDLDTANRMINFFYSASTSSKVDKLYSTRMTIHYNMSKGILESSGNVYNFTSTLECFGYDLYRDKALFGDYLNWQTYSSYSQRERKEIELGVNANINQLVDLSQIYTSKIYKDIDYNTFTYKAYKLTKSGAVDYSSEISLDVSNYTFKFSEDIALVLSSTINDEVKYGLVYVRGLEEPSIEIIDEYVNDNKETIEACWTKDLNTGYYVSNKSYYKGDLAHIPTIKYNSYGVSYTNMNAYNSESDFYHINQVDTSIYILKNGVYTKVDYDYNVWNNALFEMTSDEMVVLYHLTDRYNKVYNLLFLYKGEDKGSYQIVKDEEVVSQGSLSYSSGGVRNTINVVNRESLELVELDEPFNTNITLNVGSNSQKMTLSSFTIYTKEATYKGTTYTEFASHIDSNYALINFVYVSGSDTYTQTYVYNLKINGKAYSNFEITTNEAFYVNTKYKLGSATLMTLDGTKISESNISVSKYVGSYYTSVTDTDVSIDMPSYTFLKSGKYRLYYKFSFNLDEYEEYALKDYNESNSSYSITYRYVTLSRDIEVYDLDKEINVTYVTDSAHPFRSDLANVNINLDGSYSYTLSINMNKINYALDTTYFASSNDNLYKWGYKKINGKIEEYVLPGRDLGSVGVKRNTTNVYLYAIWDEGLVVSANYVSQGVSYNIGTITYYKNTSGNYTLNLSDFRFSLPSNSTHEGWISDKESFYRGTGETRVYSNTTTSLFDESFVIYESCTITAILKEPIKLKFYKYNINDTLSEDSITLINTLPAKTILESHTISESLKANEIKTIKKNSPSNTLYYAIYIDGKLIQIDFDTTLIEKSYLNNGNVMIVAVYEE